MPVFEYQCLDCERVFEVLVRRVDPTPTQVCPTCGTTNVQRLFSKFAAQTGGGGCGSDGIG